MPLLAEGQSIKDTYEVERFLGEGAFAEVYRVRHRFLGRQAMKVFKKEGLTAGEVEKMLSEAILLSRIGHPNIVRVFDANVLETDAGLRGYFTMENVAGGTLEAFRRSFASGIVPVDTAVDLVRQICRGLAVAHAERPPVIHRDIKPQHVLVGYEADGLRARIGDFGLARQVNPLTLLASAAGTLPFKPPEVFANAKSDSPAGDVYAVGVTLYVLLSGCFPYEIGPDFSLVAPSDFDKPPRPLPELNLDVDDALSALVTRSVAKDPRDRYPDARALLAALDEWVRGDSPHAESAEKKSHAGSAENSKKKTHAESAGGAEKNSHAEFAESAETKGAPSTAAAGRDAPTARPNLQLGTCEPGTARPERARDMVYHALKTAREDGRLADAADLMEEAFNLQPGLREKYASRVKLWRAGVSM